jgi:serine/threonine-protein kinase
MFYELLTGKPPFVGETPAATLHMHLKDQPPRVGTTVLDCPPALDDLVRRLMEKDPAKRPGSAQEVAIALQAITPTIEVRMPKRTLDVTPPRGMPVRTQPVTVRQEETSESVTTPLPGWLPMTLATTIVVSLLLNMLLLSSMWAARTWESSYIAALDHSNPVVRAHAARELGKSPNVSGRGLEAVSNKLSDPDPSVRIAAAEGLGSAGRSARGYVTALHKVQKENEDPGTREAAGAAQKAINNAPVIPRFGGFLRFLAFVTGLAVLGMVWYRDTEFVRTLKARALASRS